VETPVEIRYEGVVIDRISGMSGTMEQGGIVQLTTTAPMPVGTRLELCVGGEVSYVRVVRVTESPVPAASAMHVRAVGLSEPFEVTLLPNPDYTGEHRADARPRPTEPPRAPEPPVEPPILTEAVDGEAVPEPIGAESSLNGAGDHMNADEISGLHETGVSSEYPATGNGNGTNNKRRRRRRR
jgi:hypothetical protein